MIALVMPGPTEWMFICIIIFVLFGAKKVPEFAKGIAEAIREFHKSKREITDALQEKEEKK